MSVDTSANKRLRAGDYIRIFESDVWKDARVKCMIDSQLFRIDYECGCWWKGNCVHTCLISDENKAWKRDTPQNRDLRSKQSKQEELKKAKEEEIARKEKEKREREREMVREVVDLFGDDDEDKQASQAEKEAKLLKKQQRMEQAQRKKREEEAMFAEAMKSGRERKERLSREKLERRLIRQRERKEYERQKILELRLSAKSPVSSKIMVWDWAKEVEEFMDTLRKRTVAAHIAMKQEKEVLKRNNTIQRQTPTSDDSGSSDEEDDELDVKFINDSSRVSACTIKLEDGEYVVVLARDVLRVEEGPCEIFIDPNVEVVGEIKKMNWKARMEANEHLPVVVNKQESEALARIPGFDLYYA